ncbi:hypothetical protein FRC07_006818, partial [Ceratobasidium sp. 392]
MASVHPTIQLPPGVEDITGRVKLYQASEYAYKGAGVGGSADIFCGTYRPKNGTVIEVAVKCIRITNVDGKDDDYVEKAQKKLSRELQMWYTLGGGPNIIELLGVMQGIGSLPAPMTDTLQGLMYMHELKPSPIIHGDIKSENILVTADEKAILCDFGRSRFPQDQPRELTGSSPFVATYRYMSPELFVPNVAGPTPASDVWAYGCVGLEHRNIVDIIGIDSSFEPHPGFVLEYCAGGSLTTFCNKHHAMDLDSTVRLPAPDANAYSLICDILEGLGYMHNYPVPIPQGDLTPDNILVFTGLRPYAGHLRDDFAGVDSVRGLPPGDISRIDYSKQLGERVLVPRESSWITNGIWDLTSKCWALNPLLRPSAVGFLRSLKGLEGKSENWIPPNVADLAKKVQRVDQKENWIPMALYDTTWRQYNTRQGVKVYEVRMILVKSTYTPNWYSKPVQ